MVAMNRMPATYSVIRYVPSVPREEFVNVGVILICPAVSFQAMLTLPDFGKDSRIKALVNTDGLFVRHALNKLDEALRNRSINEILGQFSDPRANLGVDDLSNLWEMYRTNNIQLSPPRPATTTNPASTLEELFREFVSEPPRGARGRIISRKIIRREVTNVFRQEGLFGAGKVQEEWELPTLTKPTVDLAYQNHVWHCFQAIAFAAAERTVTNDVNAYRSVARDAREGKDLEEAVKKAVFTVLADVPRTPNPRVSNLIAALKDDVIEVADYREAPQIAQDIARDLREHDLVAQV
jgi:hypothetical protein